MRGHINPNYFYYLALDTDQDPGTGPVPVVVGYGFQSSGWGTIFPIPAGQVDPIVPPFFVEYNGSIQQFRNNQPLGVPYRYSISDDAKTLTVEVDLSLLDPLIATQLTSPYVQLNWITMRSPDDSDLQGTDRKEYDGFGSTGNDYLDVVPLKSSYDIVSGRDGIPSEPTYGNGESTASDEDLDIAQWEVHVEIL